MSKDDFPKFIINSDCGKPISPLTLQLFSDGSCISNGSKSSTGGFAAIFVNGYLKNKIILGNLGKLNNKPPTNIRAEGMAIIEVLKLLLKEIKSDKWQTAQLFTDSEFWLKMITQYMPKWSETQFNAKANPDLTKQIWNDWNKIMASGKDLEIIHVYAHNKAKTMNSTNKYEKFCYDNNNIADILATYARVQLKENEKKIINH